MSLRDDATRLRDMLDHAREAMAFASKKKRSDLDSDRLLYLALCQSVLIIGEAASHVSEWERAAITEVPWQKIVGMRNWLAHGYAEVDRDILWKTVTEELPRLTRNLIRRLGEA